MIQSIGSKQPVTPKPKRYKEFVFISDSTLKFPAGDNRQLQINLNNYFLDRAEIGDIFTIEDIYAPRNIINQLRDLRFKTNSIAELVSRTDNGSVIVKLNQTLIGLGQEIAQRIVVARKGKK